MYKFGAGVAGFLGWSVVAWVPLFVVLTLLTMPSVFWGTVAFIVSVVGAVGFGILGFLWETSRFMKRGGA